MGKEEIESKNIEKVTPLELASTEELLAELFKRFDHAVFVSEDKKTKDLHERDLHFASDELASVGLLRWGLIHIEGGFYDDRDEGSVDLGDQHGQQF